MKDSERIAVLENEVEARLLDAELAKRDIPYRMRTYHDSAYDGVFQGVYGWGQVEAPSEYRDDILRILRCVRPQ